MVCQASKATRSTQPTTKQIDVTDLTPNQRRQLFKDHISQEGFSAFIKNQNNQQTHYTFQYKTKLASQPSLKITRTNKT